MTDYAVWWLSQEDCEQMGCALPPSIEWPEYIRRQYLSRLGRAGRGRLWIGDGIEFEGIREEDWHGPFAEGAEKSCGGIVLHARDVPLVLALPGYVTAPDMSIWRAHLAPLNDQQRGKP